MSSAGAPKARAKRERLERRPSSPRNYHRQVLVEHEGAGAEVDEGIAPLILALWRRGFRTISSCEHEPGTPCAWIGFPTLEEAERFQRMTGVMIVVPEEQDFAGASEASFDAGYSVRGSAVAFFPVADTPAVLAA